MLIAEKFNTDLRFPVKDSLRVTKLVEFVQQEKDNFFKAKSSLGERHNAFLNLFKMAHPNDRESSFCVDGKYTDYKEAEFLTTKSKEAIQELQKESPYDFLVTIFALTAQKVHLKYLQHPEQLEVFVRRAYRQKPEATTSLVEELQLVNMPNNYSDSGAAQRSLHQMKNTSLEVLKGLEHQTMRVVEAPVLAELVEELPGQREKLPLQLPPVTPELDSESIPSNDLAQAVYFGCRARYSLGESVNKFLITCAMLPRMILAMAKADVKEVVDPMRKTAQAVQDAPSQAERDSVNQRRKDLQRDKAASVSQRRN